MMRLSEQRQHPGNLKYDGVLFVMKIAIARDRTTEQDKRNLHNL